MERFLSDKNRNWNDTVSKIIAKLPNLKWLTWITCILFSIYCSLFCFKIFKSSIFCARIYIVNVSHQPYKFFKAPLKWASTVLLPRQNKKPISKVRFEIFWWNDFGGYDQYHISWTGRNWGASIIKVFLLFCRWNNGGCVCKKTRNFHVLLSKGFHRSVYFQNDFNF